MRGARPRRSAPRSRSFGPANRRQGQGWLALDARLAIAAGAPVEFDLSALRPRTRGDCEHGIRPCPWVACRHHLYLDINPDTGSIKINKPDLELDDMADSCSLDVAELGGLTLDVVGRLLNVTRERCRQIETRALALANAAPTVVELRST